MEELRRRLVNSLPFPKHISASSPIFKHCVREKRLENCNNSITECGSKDLVLKLVCPISLTRQKEDYCTTEMSFLRYLTLQSKGFPKISKSYG